MPMPAAARGGWPMLSGSPSPNGANGRANGHLPNGQFAPGNPGGRGNPHSAAVARLRSALLRAITEGDIEAIVKALIKKAKEGDVAAAKELLDRTLGKPVEADLIERLEAVEAATMARKGKR